MKKLLCGFVLFALVTVSMPASSVEAGNCGHTCVVQSQAVAVSPLVLASPLFVQSYAVPTFQAQAVIVPQVVRQKVVVRQARPLFSIQRSVNRSFSIGR